MTDLQLMEEVLEAWVHEHEPGGVQRLETALARMYIRIHEDPNVLPVGQAVND